MNLRKLAKAQICRVRLPGVCNGNRETTVLAHVREGFYGMGVKPPDLCGVHACSSCHDAIDGRSRPKHLTPDEITKATLRALCEQLTWYADQGVVKW